ncbi:hypothetical protein ACFYPC_09085 [Streptomyces sp. NPDC005808]
MADLVPVSNDRIKFGRLDDSDAFVLTAGPPGSSAMRDRYSASAEDA